MTTYALPDGRVLSEKEFRRLRHASCMKCYVQTYPARTPVRVEGAGKERCCFCGSATAAGIYVVAELDVTQCGGEHP